jgi:hypothetical protein
LFYYLKTPFILIRNRGCHQNKTGVIVRKQAINNLICSFHLLSSMRAYGFAFTKHNFNLLFFVKTSLCSNKIFLPLILLFVMNAVVGQAKDYRLI